MNIVRDRLLTLYRQLAQHFASEPHWWPIITDTPRFEVLIGTVLVQQTRWQTVEAAIARLREQGLLSPQALAAADTSELALLIRPCAFHTQKAPGLQTICRHVVERYDGRIDLLLAQERNALRNELLALPRIGRETADTLMLYAGGHPIFVVDAYARRLFSRVGLFSGILDPERAPYDALQRAVETCVEGGPLPAPLWIARDGGTFEYPFPSAPHPRALSEHARFYWELHALIVEACIHHCTASRPRCQQPGLRPRFVDPRKCAEHCLVCAGCPLRHGCAWHLSNS
jgi:endonuclease-3 related protein